MDDAHSFGALADRLSHHALAVCQRYLCKGRRSGNYWQVGDVLNTPGQSLYVRLSGPSRGKGAAGKWSDAATGEHGDLLDLIRLNRGLNTPRELRQEALSFLGEAPIIPPQRPLADKGEAARRLFSASRPIRGTLAASYLHSRAIDLPADTSSLRFHPNCYYRNEGESLAYPALVAAITAIDGTMTGVTRIYLSPGGTGKADIPDPKRNLGHLLGHGVRIGQSTDLLVAGEGLETMLSVQTLLPDIPAVAALSANHLAALMVPPTLARLYIAGDNDPEGLRAADRLASTARRQGIAVNQLLPLLDDWNSDLMMYGLDDTRRSLLRQM